MEKLINESQFTENSSTYSDKKEKKNKFDGSNYSTLYANLIESLSNDKSDTDKIKALIILEQNLVMIKDKNKLFHIFRIFENYLNDTDSLNSNILKGQILMTTTTILIILNAKEDHPQIFLNFVDNILIEHIKNTNNYSNIYLRQISCQCLEELENEYPGLLFNLMGKKTIDILDLKDYTPNNPTNNDDRSVISSTKSNKTRNSMQNFDNKRIELENYGLYNLIEEEVFYVFQNYLSLYTTIFKHLIDYYFFEKFVRQNFEKDSKESKDDINFSMNQNNQNKDEINETNEYEQIVLDEELNMNKMNKQTNSGIFNSNFLSILNNIPYFKRFQAFGTMTTGNQKSQMNIENNLKNSQSYSNTNYINFFQGNKDKKSDRVLHIRDQINALKYNYIFEKINSEDTDLLPTELTSKISQLFLSYINKALSRIIHLLPKTSEMIQTKICKLLKFIVSKIEINHNALLPFFSYFHLNSNSAILTLTAIKIGENFKSSLKENFILKLVLKLCLLINDLRFNKALRVLAIRWLLNLRFSNYSFNFNKHMPIFSYYLCPFPFDNIIVSLEKLKTLFLFYENISYKDSEFIIKSISIMDNYKYYPIFSNYVKSLFKAYFFIILRFPLKKFIRNLCEILRENLKEVPRILPNMINLLRIIKNLNLNENNNNWSLVINNEENENLIQNFNNSPNFNSKNNNNSLDLSTRMTFQEIHKYLLIEFSKFIAEFNSHTRLNKYFELFIEIAKENSIDPQNIIIGLRNLHNSILDMRNWKIEKNILEVCKYLLKHHDLEIMKENGIHLLLYDIQTKSFDYGIRDKAKLYYELVTNVEKKVLNTFLEIKSTQFNFLNVPYDFIEFGNNLQNILNLEQSKIERLKEKISDGGSAIFDQNFKQNVMLLSNNVEKYSEFVYKKPINNSAKEMNDLNNTEELNKIIDNILTPNDILRLYVKDDMIDDTNDALIDTKKIFEFDSEFKFSESENKIEEVEKFLKNIIKNNSIEEKFQEDFLNKFLDDYFVMINNNKFYIKLPLNVYMTRDNLCSNNEIFQKLNNIKKIYSINLCFGKMSHLDIKGPVLLPYLEMNENISENNLQFPYFYKIYLIVYPNLPIPSDVEVRAIFYNKEGVCFTGMLNSIKINFEDFFLPISVPPQYKSIYDQINGKITLREVLFKKLWRFFKINDSNFNQFVNTSRMIDLDMEVMINLVFERLGPFLIDQNFLKIDFVVNSPYQDKKLENERVDVNHNTCRVKDYYDNITNKFSTNSYDFSMDEFLEKNAEKSYFVKNNVLRPSKYHLAEVIIFVPEKFHILMKIKISEFSSIFEIRSDCLKIIEYLDEYFDTWIV